MAQTDREALAALYHATGGPNWKNSTDWDTDADLSDWHGVKTNGQGRVVELRLDENNLQGPIPPELGNLRKLQTVQLHGNQLTGPIPKELGALSELRTLVFSKNRLTGPIPPELGKLGALRELFLGGNELSGTIPAQLGALNELTWLDLSDNQLSGPIPEELGALSKLELLGLQLNRLTGPIPKELGALSKLEQLDLHRNRFTGPIPKELGTLSKLEKLWLNSNQLTGHIPPQLGDLGALMVLYLANNKLNGPIPPELGKLGALRELFLGGNELSGPIPHQLGALTKLEVLRLNHNLLTGPIPKELGALSMLEYLRLHENGLTGPIPPELGELRELRELWLRNNQLTGAVPKEFANLSNLRFNVLKGNMLEPPLPPTSHGFDMRDWGGFPTEDDKLRVRAATRRKNPGAEQPVIVKSLAFLIDLWHVVVPVVDDVTDVLLLTSTADPASALWWICLITLAVAEIERLWLLFTLCLTMASLPFQWCFDTSVSCCCCEFDFFGSPAPRLFAVMNCRNSAPKGTFRGRLADSFLWVLVGSRSRCSPFWRMISMSLDVKVDDADHAGIGFGAIDKWVSRHPFRFLGKMLFGARFALKGGDEGESRRAGVMIRAVGETLVVDSFFLALSVVSEGWDGNLTGVAGFSALFSVLELLTELQYYVAEAGAVLEPVSSPGPATSGGRSEQGAVSDSSTIGVTANV